MIEILSAPPFMTVQDLGRPGHRAEGVPPAGAMDAAALALVNRAVGNPAAAAGFEWALGAGTLRFSEARTIAVGGAGPVARMNGGTLPAWEVVRVQAGGELVLEPPTAGRFCYLAISGGLDVPVVLGSRSTYLPGRFGGHEGRRLRKGDQVPVGPETGRETGTVPRYLRPDYTRPIRLVDGPQADLFDAETWDRLLGAGYEVSPASDRMGYRLQGTPLPHRGPAALPSEPACPGAIQIPDGGAPIVLMPDGPTVGGYPKLAVVISADLGLMAQWAPGSRPRFERVSLGEAVRAWKETRSRVQQGGSTSK